MKRGRGNPHLFQLAVFSAITTRHSITLDSLALGCQCSSSAAPA